jgi:hypothetical protein
VCELSAVHALLLPQIAEGRAHGYNTQHVLEAQRVLAQPYTSSGEPSNGRMTMLRVRGAEPERPRYAAAGAPAAAGAAVGTPATGAATGAAATGAATGAAAAAAAAATAVGGAAGAEAATGLGIPLTVVAVEAAAAAAAAAVAVAAAAVRSTDHSERADSTPPLAPAAAASAPSDTVADMLRDVAYRCDTTLLRRWIQAADFGVTFVLQLQRPVPAQNLLCMLSKLAEGHSSRGDRPSAQLIQYAIQQLQVAQAVCAQQAAAAAAAAAGSEHQTEPRTEPETEPTTEPVSAATVSKEWVLLLQRSAQLSTVLLQEVRSLRHAVLLHAVVVRTGTVGAHRY